MKGIQNAALLALALGQTSHALKATILADTNRDGIVDTCGDSDAAGKNEWTEERGALFLANIGDSNKRCRKLMGADAAAEDMERCHDAADSMMRSPQYLAPLRTVPMADLSPSATGSIRIGEARSAELVRIFVKEGQDWTFVGKNYTFTADQLAVGLNLGIDARDVRRPGKYGWDGRTTVHFSITNEDETVDDSVILRVAPLLTHHHAQLAERVFTSTHSDRWPWTTESQRQFNLDVQAAVEDAGIEEPLFVIDDTDIWTQDFFETGYSSIPGPDGPVVIRIMLRSFQYRSSGEKVFSQLRDTGVGAVQDLEALEFGGTLDSTGNLETVPPHSHNGKTYPAGRIIMGAYGDADPEFELKALSFLRAQETQDPIILDTSWLLVGHVDEFIQFLPADNERGWVVMVHDPIAALEMLREASAAGHGNAASPSRPRLPSDHPEYCVRKSTIDEDLRLERFTQLNEMAAKRIQKNVDIIKRETGVTDDEIIGVPGLFYWFDYNPMCHSNSTNSSSTASTWNRPRTGVRLPRKIRSHPSRLPSIVQAASGPRSASSFHRKRQSDEDPSNIVVAYLPSTINGVVLSNNYYLAANPWGPVIDGRDIFAEKTVEAYGKVGFNVTFMDDYFSHHVGGGEVHCGSNSWRNADDPWW